MSLEKLKLEVILGNALLKISLVNFFCTVPFIIRTDSKQLREGVKTGNVKYKSDKVAK